MGYGGRQTTPVIGLLIVLYINVFNQLGYLIGLNRYETKLVAAGFSLRKIAA